MKEPSDELQLIRLVNQQYRLEHQMQKTEKTLILFELYDSIERESDKIKLNNMHVCAMKILDKDLNVEVREEEDQDGRPANLYVVAEQQTSPLKITREVFEVGESQPGKEAESQPGIEAESDSICIYEAEGRTDLRVIFIPIKKEMIDISKINEEGANDQEEHKRMIQSFRTKGFQGESLREAHANWERQRLNRTDQRCEVAKVKHLRMYRIEAFLDMVLQKTHKVSIGGFTQFSDRRYINLEGYQQEFPRLFSVPKDFVPQYLCYGYSPKRKILVREAEKEGITTVFSLLEGSFGIEKFKTLEEKYFFPTDNIRTNIYANMKNSNNDAINRVIEEFVKSWSRITLDTALAFSTVLKQASSFMSQDKPLEDLSASFELSASKDIANALTFSEVFQKYIPDNLLLLTKLPLVPFYNPERLKSVKAQKGRPTIPSSIENLTFVHFFYKTGREFLEQQEKKSVELGGNSGKSLRLWKEALRDIYSLVDAANKTFLRLKENEEFICKDMTRFFNFLCFTIDSLEKIKKLTSRQLSIESELKMGLEQLRFRKEKILSYIVRNEGKIKPDQEISYYQLYLLIISENSSKDAEKDLEYIYLHIHELMAFKIATQYIYDYEKVVQAVKSYALIVLKYPSLPETKKQLIDILKIYPRLARLLKIVGQEESAALIYIKFRELDFADKCYSKALVRIVGSADEKTKKMIAWGKQFENALEYDLALSYYRKAFSNTKDTQIKQTAIRHKLDCGERMRNGPTQEELRMHLKFLDDGDLLAYCSHVNLEAMLHQLRVSLSWDKKAQCSTILEQADEEVRDPAQSFFGSFQDSSPKLAVKD